VSLRVVNYGKRKPRVWDHLSEESIEAWLVDRVWIERKVQQPGDDDGTPIFSAQTYGPYAGKLTQPVTREAFQQDRERLEVTNSLAVASDVQPRESDTIIVEFKGSGIRRRYRVEGTVNPRPSAWGTVPLYQVDLTRVEEY
jgi:hypothetical protein